MKGFDFMSKYNSLITTEDKACFIASNMEIGYAGLDFDEVLLFTIRIDKTIYSVSDYEGFSVFFERYDEASNYAEELIETLISLKDVFDENETLTMRIAKNHLSFSETIRGDDIDSCRLSDLFDDNAFNEVEFITNAEIVIRDGSVKETFKEMKEGE